jgi:anti-anti-sigma factor
MEHTVSGDTLELSGSIDVRCTAELRVLVYGLLAQHPGDVHVDISRVESVDMTALKLLAVANRVAERDGHRVVLRGGSPGVRRLLHLSHLRSVLAVEPSEPAGTVPAEPSEPTGQTTRV